MSTQEDKSHIETMMDELGISLEASTTDEAENNTNVNEDENDLSDSDTATLDAETEEATETETELSDTELRLKELEDRLAMADKRLTDKDKFINELQQKKKEEVSEDTTEVEDETEDDFWDDPEKKFKDVVEKLRITTLRLDENSYAMNKADYFDLVNGENLQEAFRESPDFQAEFQASAKPYETAYLHLKQSKETKAKETISSREKLKEEMRQELMKEMNIKPSKGVVPNTANMGSKSSGSSNADSDGFASVFGKDY